MISTGYLDVGTMPKGIVSYVEIFFCVYVNRVGGDCHGLRKRGIP